MSKTNTVESIFLSVSDLEFLTGRTKPSKQIQTLSAMGISFTINAKGNVIVSKAHVQSLLRGQTDKLSNRNARPDFSQFIDA